MSSIWPVESDKGTENWRWDGARFVSVNGATSPEQRLDHESVDVDCLDVRIGRDKPSAGRTCEACTNFLPHTFKYCPSCGEPTRALIDPASPLWCSTTGNSSGLRVSAGAVGFTSKEREFSLPYESDDLAFACGGVPRRLVAIERRQGAVFLLRVCASVRPHGNPWSKVDAQKLSLLPPHPEFGRVNWGAAPTKQGVLLPAEKFPVWLDLSGRSPRLCEPSFGLSVSLGCIAGPIVQDEEIHVPVWTSTNALALATITLRGTSGTPEGVVKSVGGGEGLERSPALAAPVRDAKLDRVYWPGETGFLAMVKGEQPTWRPWRDNDIARLDCRPAQSGDAFYQLVKTADQSNYAYHELTLAKEPDRRLADGPCLSVGKRHFRVAAMLDEPWKPAVASRAESGFVPLLACESAELRTFGLYVKRLDGWSGLMHGGPQASAEAELCWRLPSGRIDDLKRPLFLRSTIDAQVFFYNNHFYLYHSSARKAWSWPLGES